jgi:nucleoside-diphosphate-sugar epimerase
VLARRAADVAGHKLDVIAVSRFAQPGARAWLESRGVRTLSADLFDRDAVRNLPEAPNIIYMVGRKFGTGDNPSLTWAVNTLVPPLVMEHYKGANVVALSTGNVYPPVTLASGGAGEETGLTPLGEYANAAVARERLFQYFSLKNGTRVALVRLNYAVELRYGVLVDIARKVWESAPVDLANGWFNCMWQGDANEMILRMLALTGSPAKAWNLTGPEILSVRDVAEQLGRLLGKQPVFTGQEGERALLNNSARLCAELGKPATPIDQVMGWIAQWIKAGGRTLDKPTHFEVSDGRY